MAGALKKPWCAVERDSEGPEREDTGQTWYFLKTEHDDLAKEYLAQGLWTLSPVSPTLGASVFLL